ncbi:uncharacterized protein LOC132551918 [Ylistrum balloti]|uniref:uncharacterized protein LOC132551918 n=1 Tax=Ylistrum balloti TaxID=509963 RepID=UPI002905E4A8|nr:uncharacterized protein LOC132551918 [Ylistrum balloti]
MAEIPNAENSRTTVPTIYSSASDPYNSTSDPYSGTSEPYSGTSDPYSSTSDPYNSTSDPYSGTSDPYSSTSSSTSDPYNSTVVQVTRTSVQVTRTTVQVTRTAVQVTRTAVQVTRTAVQAAVQVTRTIVQKTSDAFRKTSDEFRKTSNAIRKTSDAFRKTMMRSERPVHSEVHKKARSLSRFRRVSPTTGSCPFGIPRSKCNEQRKLPSIYRGSQKSDNSAGGNSSRTMVDPGDPTISRFCQNYTDLDTKCRILAPFVIVYGISADGLGMHIQCNDR